MSDPNSPDIGKISDGYHTFDDLYEHRYALFIALCRVWALHLDDRDVWRSRLHADGTMYDGWFILGLFTEPGDQISYHLPLRLWDETGFAHTLERAPTCDGHTPADAIKRLYKL